jgi:uncharacterized membrane protein YcjF (UPF0283 family)
MKKLGFFGWVILLSVLAIVYLAAYFVHFHGGFSGDSERWAYFGEYVGGVFATVAFVGVLITLWMQHAQLELLRQQNVQLREQSAVDELHRICRDVASNIDRLLDDPKGLEWGRNTQDILKDKSQVLTARGVLEALSGSDSSQREVLSSAIPQRMNVLVAEFNLLARCASEAQNQGGSTVIVDYYRNRYEENVRRMRVLERNFSLIGFWPD